MDAELNKQQEANQLNLENYYPAQRSYNSVLYIHKRFLPRILEEADTTDSAYQRHINKEHRNKQKAKQTKQNKNKHHRHSSASPRTTTAIVLEKLGRAANRTKMNNDTVLDHTIQFAKDIVPLLLPPSDGNPSSPIYYTIEATKKTPKPKKVKDTENFGCQVALPKSEFIEKTQKDSVSDSVRSTNTLTHSSQCFDKINLNQSFDCTLSEMSDKKHSRRHTNKQRVRNDKNLIHSESFEALAAEMKANGDAKIKIQLMNDTDKSSFIDDIKNPIVKAVADSIKEIKEIDKTEYKTLQNIVLNNTKKLDSVLQKLASIENKIDNRLMKQTNARAVGTDVKSKLDVLKEDVISEDCEDLEEDTNNFEVRELNNNNSVTKLAPLSEEVSNFRRFSNDEISSDTKCMRPSKMPTRYCWSEANGRRN